MMSYLTKWSKFGTWVAQTQIYIPGNGSKKPNVHGWEASEGSCPCCCMSDSRSVMKKVVVVWAIYAA